MEKWIPCDWLPTNDVFLDSVKYTNQDEKDTLELYFSGVNDNCRYKIIFYNVFSYRITLEHFLFAPYSEKDFALICSQPYEFVYRIQNSLYVEEMNRCGMYDLNTELHVNHYRMQTDTHIVDVILHVSSKIIIEDISTNEIKQIDE